MTRKNKLSRREFIQRGFGAAGATIALNSIPSPIALGLQAKSTTRPNIIIINADDLGYGDLSCYGSEAIKTPNLDKMADNGVRFTDFYACSAVCTPSRFGLLTGRYPQRAGINFLFFPKKWAQVAVRAASMAGMADGDGAVNDVDGIPADETTIAESLKKAGYRTALIGKWHLGNYLKSPEHHPTEHGFDHFYGVPYSNSNKLLPLSRGKEIIEENIQGEEQGKLTGLYTSEAVRFIEGAKDRPFFCYFSHTFPHRPHFASANFKGQSEAGRYGDAVEEVDWSVGEIMDCLERNHLLRQTLVVFTSDNGPWYNGSPGNLRGRKGQSYEGGTRVPMIASWAGQISPGTVCREPAMNIDFLPTCLSLAGLKMPTDRIIDGRDISGLLLGRRKKTPHETLYFYHHDKLEGIRHGKWKFYPKIHPYVYPVPIETIREWSWGGPWLYNLELDPGESYNLRAKHPEIVNELTAIMEQRNREMEINLKGLI
jgi:arylsulfatase A